MKTAITFRQMKSSDAIKIYVNEKLEKLDRYAEDPKEAHVIFWLERHLHHAEIVFSGKGVHATARAESGDMYSSIDEVLDKIEKTLRRHHDKIVKARTSAPRADPA